MASSATFLDALFVCTPPVAPYLQAACAQADPAVRYAPGAGLRHHNGTVRMTAVQVVGYTCRFSASPRVQQACADTRDELMYEPFRAFHAVALILSETMLAQSPARLAAGEEQDLPAHASCLHRYEDRGRAEIEQAAREAARYAPCRWEHRPRPHRAPFHQTGVALAARVLEAHEARKALERATTRTLEWERVRPLLGRIQSSSPWLAPAEALRPAYAEHEAAEATAAWLDHRERDADAQFYTWTKLRGDRAGLWVAPFDRLGIACAALHELPPSPASQRLSRDAFLGAVYESNACPVSMALGDVAILDRGVPHKLAESRDGVGARMAWSRH